MKKTTFFSTCLLVLFFASSTLLTPAAPVGVETCSFRGSQDKILVQTPDFQISEADLYLFAVLTGFIDPSLVEEWETLSGQELTLAKKTLDLYITSLYYANHAEPISTAQEIEMAVLAKRITTYGAARFLWGDLVIRDQIVLFPEDVAYYLNLHLDQFSTEEYLEVRWIRVAVPSTATREEKDSALQRAKTLRTQAVELGGLLPLMEKDPTLLMGPVDQIKKVTRTDKNLDPLIVDEAYKMKEGQISLPTRTRSGYVLFEILHHVSARPLELEKAYPVVKNELIKQLLPQQYDYRLGKAIINSHSVNRSHLYNFLPDDAIMVQVSDFNLYKNDFDTLFPEMTTQTQTPSLSFIKSQCQDIESGEVILQGLEKTGEFLGDPFFQQAKQMADILYLATKYQRTQRNAIDVSEENIMSWLSENREQLLPGPAKLTWRIDIYPRQEKTLTKPEKKALQSLMIDEMNLVLEKIRQRLKEQQEVSENSNANAPDRILRNLPTPTDRRLMISYTPMGPLTESQAKTTIGIPFEDLKVGKFTSPTTLRDGTVASYYTGKQEKQPDPTEEELIQAAKTKLLYELATQDIHQKIQTQLEEGQIHFAPPFDQAPNNF